MTLTLNLKFKMLGLSLFFCNCLITVRHISVTFGVHLSADKGLWAIEFQSSQLAHLSKENV